jgi:hypothetical protein
MTMSVQRTREINILGFPISDFGFLSSLLLALSSGFLAFFATAFLSIVFLLFYNIAGHHTVDYSFAYKKVAFPVGCVSLLLGLLVFGVLWIRSKVLRK